MKYLKVKNWEQFQHYNKRNPPWIKLHNSLLRDYEFQCLQDASKLHLMLIWLLASQMENKIPADEEFIKNQIGIKGNVNLKELINKGYLVDDSGVLAGCKQSAIPETEAYSKETKKETERGDFKKSPSPTKNKSMGTRLKEDWELPDDWGDWADKKYGWGVKKIVELSEDFKDYWIAKNGKDAIKLSWKRTWQRWCRKQQEGF